MSSSFMGYKFFICFMFAALSNFQHYEIMFILLKCWLKKILSTMSKFSSEMRIDLEKISMKETVLSCEKFKSKMC